MSCAKLYHYRVCISTQKCLIGLTIFFLFDHFIDNNHTIKGKKGCKHA